MRGVSVAPVSAGAAGQGDIADWRDKIFFGDNLPLLRRMPSESVALICIDPPFNTGKRQSRNRIRAVAVAEHSQGDRNGFGGKRYRTEAIGESAYADSFVDYIGFLRPRLAEAHRLLAPDGSLFFHIDWRESARCRLLLEEIFGGARHCLNEIIWAYDYGGRSKNKWPAKHDNIYWFAKDPECYVFNHGAGGRIPYRAPGLVGEEKASRGKTPTDVWGAESLVNMWWRTIVPTNGGEKTGYPTQKPLSILERIVRTHSRRGDVVLDFFAGSGTTGLAAKNNGRHYVMMDSNKEAVDVMNGRICGSSAAPPPKSDIRRVFDAKAIALSQEERATGEQWVGSEYGWLCCLPAAAKSEAGRRLAAELMEKGLGLPCGKRREMLFVNGKRIAVKLSLLWRDKKYCFEQIKRDADFLFLLGISPFDAHAWIVSTRHYDDFVKQRGSDSRWIAVDPGKPDEWPDYMKSGGGALERLPLDLLR